MTESYDTLYKNGTLMTPDGAVSADLAVRDGRIAAIGLSAPQQARAVIDCTGLHVLPGVIDTQVHFREPGFTHKEDLAHGARAAVLGGVTAVFEMPNTDPLTVSAAALYDKLDRARGRMACDYAFFIGGTAQNCHEVGTLERLPGCAGIKVFMGSSTGALLLEDRAALEIVLRNMRRRASFHAEDEARLRARCDLRSRGDPSSHPVWRDEETALNATTTLVNLARQCGAKVHVLHVSSAAEMEFLARNKDVASVEVLPNHLLLHAPDCYQRLGSLAQQNPPIRGADHQAALWRALAHGVVDVLGSDHAPHTREEKSKPYPDSPSGTPGVQTLVPLMLNAVNKGHLSLPRFVDLTAHNPARLFGVAGKGALRIGFDADLTLVDMKRTQVIENSTMASKSAWTPFHGLRVTGWPVATVVRGQCVMREGEVIKDGGGQPVRFHLP